MTKVFFVEDEYVIREGIKTRVAWAENGFEFCGEAADGELALPLIQKAKPDILITDIKMPFMDGLELAQLVRNQFPDMEIVLLTGYADFDYAKEAIKIGVSEYLTKPVSGDELIAALKVIRKRIEDKKQDKEIRERYIREMTENVENEKHSLFKDLLSGEAHTAELITRAQELNMELMASCYNVMLLKIKSAFHEQAEFSKSVIRLFEEIDNICIGNPIAFDRSPEGKAYIFKGDSEETVNALIMDFEDKVRGILDSHKHIQYFGGVGDCVGRLRELNVSFESASRAFAHRYFVDENMFMHSGDVNKGKGPRGHGKEMGTVEPLQLDKTKFMEFLKLGEARDVRFFVDEFFENEGEGAIRSLLMRQYMVVDAYLKTTGFLKEIGCDDVKIEEVTENESTISDTQGAHDYLIRIMETAVSAREGISRSRYGEVVSEIMDYINENYSDPEFSLNTVAQYMNFSPNHLSMIFCRETGVTFIKYLTDLRITKAKELLRCTAKRSAEICEEVGYKDPHYFSFLFKKNVGVTPTDYRENSK